MAHLGEGDTEGKGFSGGKEGRSYFSFGGRAHEFLEDFGEGVDGAVWNHGRVGRE